MTGGEVFLSIAGKVSIGMILIGMALAFGRLVAGPSGADRVVALDLLSVLVIAFLVAFSILAEEASYLDVAIAYACIAFLGTISLARFVMRAPQNETRYTPMECNDD